APSITMNRTMFAAVSGDGGVILFGGVGSQSCAAGFSVLPDVELYPKGGPLKPMPSPRGGQSAYRTADGRVIIIGGGPTVDTKPPIYTQQTNTWDIGPVSPGPLQHAASAQLQNGCILVAGGEDGNKATSAAEMLDPDALAWTSIDPMPGARRSHVAVVI